MRRSLRIPGDGPAERALAELNRDTGFMLPTAVPAPVTPVTFRERTKNPLRPSKLDDMIGQRRMRAFLRRLIDTSRADDLPLPHLLLSGPSGYGKSTVAHVVAEEMQVQVFQVEAPVGHETLLDLRQSMGNFDVLFIDEIHQQAIMERRGRTTNTQPEVLFGVMEDRTLVSGSGVLDFPEITLIGATTDEGRLPDAFINRFTACPSFEPYDIMDLAEIADLNARALGRTISAGAAFVFAYACRGVPRYIGNYVTLASRLGTDIHEDLAYEVLNLSNVTEDGLTADMQALLIFMLEHCRQVTGDGEVVYRSGLQNLATGIGKSRDVKIIALRVEPYLIQQGYMQVSPSGRRLTVNGVTRAHALLGERG